MSRMHIIKKEQAGWPPYYWPDEKSFESELYPLWLLLDQWGQDSEMIISGIKESESFGTDYCYIQKEDGIAVLENNQWDDEDVVVQLRIPLENLYYILRKWESLVKEVPKEITLEFDGENVSLHATD